MKRLEGKNVSKSFKQRQVVHNVSLAVHEGEIIGLLGPNGAGKTTTFLMILGIHQPESGSILLNGIDITKEPVYKRARMGIGFLPQEPSIFKGLTVEENILAILDMHPYSKSQDVDAIMDEMGVTEIRHRKAYLLSGGERRRLEIARSLVLSPNFLLLDEPFAGIDPIQIKELQSLIIKLKEKNMGIIITDHNVREILKITDRSYIINRGEVIFQGIPDDLIDNERVKNEYLGKEFRWN